VGVLGLAIGFGAQTLVKDIITGAFILIEDSVSVGDIVTLSGTGGLVEAINIRTIRLRDLSGNVHTIPFSTVGTVTNMTKDFSRYLIEAGVAYREDVDEVIDVLKELGEELRKDPEWGPDMLEPIEILGLDRFEDSAVIVRARLITKPARQWSIGREFNRRLKRAFDERNIEIPFPHRTLYMGQDKDGKAPPLPITKNAPPSRDADSEDPAPPSA
jgi:small conductance mechanosensitive channel